MFLGLRQAPDAWPARHALARHPSHLKDKKRPPELIPMWFVHTDQRKWIWVLKKCVLVVEDDPLLRMDAVDIVESAGFDVIEACSADEAIERLEANAAIAIVLTDIEMPGSMNGIKLAFAVRERWPPIVIIVMSGRVEPNTADLPTRTKFIRKPYRPGQIEDALRAVPH